MKIETRAVDFVFVGPMKTGTSWVHEYLALHPSIGVPVKVKETYYFSKNYHKGTKWYAKQHDFDSEAVIFGEVSPTYFDSKEAAERILKHNSNTKVVITVREPLSRFLSHFQHNVRAGIFDANQNLEDLYKEHRRIRGHSSYVDNIHMWTNLFGASNTIVLLNEELESRPELFANKICAHLGVEEMEIPAVLNKKVGRGRTPVNTRLVKSVKKTVSFLRKLELHNIVNFVKRTGVGNLMYSKVEAEPATYVGIESVSSKLTEEALRLEKEVAIDIDLWRKIWCGRTKRSV